MVKFPTSHMQQQKIMGTKNWTKVALKQFLTFDTVVQYSYSLFVQNSLQNKHNNSKNKKTPALP
jgi:hypothetical protein